MASPKINTITSQMNSWIRTYYPLWAQVVALNSITVHQWPFYHLLFPLKMRKQFCTEQKINSVSTSVSEDTTPWRCPQLSTEWRGPRRRPRFHEATLKNRCVPAAQPADGEKNAKGRWANQCASFSEPKLHWLRNNGPFTIQMDADRVSFGLFKCGIVQPERNWDTTRTQTRRDTHTCSQWCVS